MDLENIIRLLIILVLMVWIMYLLHKGFIKVVTIRDSVKPQSKTNSKLDLIGSLLPKMELEREL